MRLSWRGSPGRSDAPGSPASTYVLLGLPSASWGGTAEAISVSGIARGRWKRKPRGLDVHGVVLAYANGDRAMIQRFQRAIGSGYVFGRREFLDLWNAVGFSLESIDPISDEEHHLSIERTEVLVSEFGYSDPNLRRAMFRWRGFDVDIISWQVDILESVLPHLRELPLGELLS